MHTTHQLCAPRRRMSSSKIVDPVSCSVCGSATSRSRRPQRDAPSSHPPRSPLKVLLTIRGRYCCVWRCCTAPPPHFPQGWPTHRRPPFFLHQSKVVGAPLPTRKQIRFPGSSHLHHDPSPQILCLGSAARLNRPASRFIFERSRCLNRPWPPGGAGVRRLRHMPQLMTGT